jgi:hypothetical protein
METAYSNGVLYKTQTPKGNIAYNFSEKRDVEYKDRQSICADGSKKSYVFLRDVYEKDGFKVFGEGATNTYTELYFWLQTANDLDRLVLFYGLDAPIVGDTRQAFNSDFSDWGLRLAYQNKIANPVIASVKFDSNNVAYMLKLYRGNYIPTDLEIQEAKDYWSNVPS